ncbi:MAG: chemotaxis protein, partial [Pseudomonadota bacterium]
MSVRRKRFRIEEVFGTAPMPNEVVGSEPMPMHREIMAELRAIRAQMGTPGRNAVTDQVGAAADQQIAEAQSLLATYRAQIEQCEKLKIELDLIHDAITRTKQEIAVLHGKSFEGDEMAKVNG